MQRLSQQQKQLLKLSPQQIQLMKLLQVPTALLEDRIREELDENPALEINNGEDAETDLESETEKAIKELDESEQNEDYIQEEETVDNFDNIRLEDYIKEGDDEDADYNFKADAYNPEDDEDRGDRGVPTITATFYDVLQEQIGMLSLSSNDSLIAQQIIGSIDEDGYLRRTHSAIADDLALYQNIVVSESEVGRVLEIIKSLDPPGVAANDLQECLLLQLNRLPKDIQYVIIAKQIVSKYFDELSKKHYPKIQKSLNIDEEDLKKSIAVITHLNPRPGGKYDSSTNENNTIIPDFYIENNNGTLELRLNSRNAPELRLSSDYRDMLRDYEKKTVKDPKQKDAVLFLKQKLDSAKWFIDSIKQRQITLMMTMETIMNYQEDFFLTGDETQLRPMILKDISVRTGLDISTVSRVANSKFVQTEFGTYRLKYFFSESLSTESGEEVSTHEVKKILQDTIEAEDKKKPITDDQLAEILNKKGYNVARRTVAKYREQLNIAVARLRKEL
jgi:RNA polymerase sigma-54 factor